ncbi:MAG: hypothetical protein L6Q74_05015 [Sphaerotilus natans subsp. sulfidivorans]|uniref:DUF1565 domain-containing protein n=1 Tax=Sphaerotilus sulfidivorans TaxID=639200 RepID=UPI0023568F5C|nr:DUF1565 domain-containing protein [Sphaerotilus sulfidivorans]MCK6401260.1 hypothetical protein [Sphaerotilus sulfidivorans]
MATIYVRKTGDDTTGTGATGAPYLTLAKALSVAVATDVILMGAGTYPENSTVNNTGQTAGNGYLTLTNKVPASIITISTESGERDVVIANASSNYVFAVGAVSNLWFDNITFQSATGAVQGVIRLLGAAMSNLIFSRCRIRVVSASGATNSCVISAWGSGTFVISGITFNNCSLEQIGHWPSAGLNLENITGTVSEIALIDSDVRVAAFALRVKGVQGFKESGNRFNSFSPLSASTAFQLGEDAATGVAASGVSSASHVYAHAGHAAVIGGGVEGYLNVNGTFWGGNHSANGQGLVIKNANNWRLQDVAIHGGYLSGLYYKAATNGVADRCTVINHYSTSPALRVGVNNENNSKVKNVAFRRGVIWARSGTLFGWEGTTGDAGGGVCDQNAYHVSGSATLGSIRGTAVTDMASIRAAWAGYSTQSNDRSSRVGLTAVPSAGRRLIEP